MRVIRRPFAAFPRWLRRASAKLLQTSSRAGAKNRDASTQHHVEQKTMAPAIPRPCVPVRLVLYVRSADLPSRGCFPLEDSWRDNVSSNCERFARSHTGMEHRGEPTAF